MKVLQTCAFVTWLQGHLEVRLTHDFRIHLYKRRVLPLKLSDQIRVFTVLIPEHIVGKPGNDPRSRDPKSRIIPLYYFPKKNPQFSSLRVYMTIINLINSLICTYNTLLLQKDTGDKATYVDVYS